MSLTLTGTLKLIKGEEVISEKFKKREFVITDDSSQYPQHIAFQLTQNKCELINGFTVGSRLTVHFNLRGREWSSPSGEIKYFNTLEAWRIENGGSSAGNVSEYSQEPTFVGNTASGADNDDLPF